MLTSLKRTHCNLPKNQTQNNCRTHQFPKEKVNKVNTFTAKRACFSGA